MTMRTNRYWLAVGAGVVLVSGILIWGGSLRSDNVSTRETRRVAADEAYYFSTLEEMVASSDAVVEGTITDVKRGQVINEGEGHSLQYRVAPLTVDSVLFLSDVKLATLPDIVIEETGWLDGDPVIMNNVEPPAIGDVGFFFLKFQLTRPTGESAREENQVYGAPEIPLYVDVINSQGRYLVVDGRLEGSNQEDELVQTIQNYSPAQLRIAIAEAWAQFLRGEVRPQIVERCPPPGCPEDLVPASP